MMTRYHMSLSDGIGATVVTSFLSQLQVTTEPGSGLICPGPDPDLADCHVLYSCTMQLYKHALHTSRFVEGRLQDIKLVNPYFTLCG